MKDSFHMSSTKLNSSSVRVILFLFVSIRKIRVRYLTFSKKVSGLFGLKISLQYMTVTRSSVSERLMMLWV